MAYEKQTWVNGKPGGTPVSAARLGHIEDGVAAAADSADTAAAAAAGHETRLAAAEADLAAATDTSTASTLVKRRSNGWTSLAGISGLSAPASSGDAANKDYVDAVSTRVSATEATLAGATSAVTASALVKRSSSGDISVNDPTSASHPASKSYVDTGDTAAKSRTNHTGTQTSATISDLTEAVQDIVAAFLVQGANVTLTYNDAGNTLTIASTGTGSGMATKGNAVTLDGDTEQFAAFTINDDGTDTGTWPNRMEFLFTTGGVTRRTGYHNEYGEGRFAAAKSTTTPLRVLTRELGTDPAHSTSVPVFDVMDDRTNRNIKLAIYSDGRIEASNLPKRITVASSAPSSPSTGDVWIDTSA